MKNAMDDATLQTEPRLGRALVALQQSGGVMRSAEWGAAAGVKAGDAWKLAGGLRALGVEVAGSAAEGWRLAGEPDLALPEVLEPKIAETIFAGGVHHFASIGGCTTSPASDRPMGRRCRPGHKDGQRAPRGSLLRINCPTQAQEA